LSSQLDVLHLGNSVAISLGIQLYRLQMISLILISLLVAISTALVGPVTFLGFIIANIAYTYFNTYRHRALLLVSSLIAVLFLVLGQFLVEHVFLLKTTLSVVIEFTGGLYFLFILLKRKGA
jgi:iron complex transport system permease protein